MAGDHAFHAGGVDVGMGIPASQRKNIFREFHRLNEGAKAVSIGVDAVYQNTYTASLSYTDFFGGDYNMLTDRDFLAFSVGVNF